MGSSEKMADYLELRTKLEADRRMPEDVCRGRISRLLDPDSFAELDSLAGGRETSFRASRPPVAGDGVVTGYGTIDGRLVYVASQDPAVYGGSIGQIHARKICRTIELAREARSPFIALYDSGGSRIDEGIAGLEGLGDLLDSLDAASGEIPLIAAIFGPCAGGAAFAAAISDFTLMGGKGAGLYMNGPMVVAAAENKSAARPSIRRSRASLR